MGEGGGLGGGRFGGRKARQRQWRRRFGGQDRDGGNGGSRFGGQRPAMAATAAVASCPEEELTHFSHVEREGRDYSRPSLFDIKCPVIFLLLKIDELFSRCLLSLNASRQPP
jgi:hypothetical protein